MTNTELQSILGRYVVELTFVRRHEKLGWSDVRALLGTTNYDLLNGPFGKQVLYFQPPSGGGMGYNYRSRNLCVVWDMFRCDYRVFGAESVNIRKVFDLESDEERQSFYDWFYEFIINMTEQEKEDFMGYQGQAYAIQQKSRYINSKYPTPSPATIPSTVTPVTSKPSFVGKVYNRVKYLLSRFLGKK